MLTAAIIVVAAGGIGILGSIIGIYFQSQKDRKNEYDKSLRTKRLEHYPKLWEIFKPLSQFRHDSKDSTKKTDNITYGTLKEIGFKLETWYYDHGLILDEMTRKLLLIFQQMIREMTVVHPESDIILGIDNNGKIIGINEYGKRENEFEMIWAVMSRIRSSTKVALEEEENTTKRYKLVVDAIVTLERKIGFTTVDDVNFEWTAKYTQNFRK